MFSLIVNIVLLVLLVFYISATIFMFIKTRKYNYDSDQKLIESKAQLEEFKALVNESIESNDQLIKLLMKVGKLKSMEEVDNVFENLKKEKE